MIGENDFTDLDIGIETRNTGNQARGLTFLCNRNDGNRKFDFKTEFGIGPMHGKAGSPAGNTFSHSGVEDASDFSATGIGYMVHYFYNNLISAEQPLYTTDNINDIGTSAGSCAHFALFVDPDEFEDLGDFISFHHDIVDEIEDKVDELNELSLSPTQIRDLTAELRLLELAREMNISDATTFVLMKDSIVYNDLREAIGLADDFKSEVSLAFTWLDEGDDVSFISALESIGSRITLTEVEEEDQEELLILNTMLVNVYIDGRIESMLTAEEIDTVELIAYGGADLARGQARALLTYFYDYIFSEGEPEEFRAFPIGHRPVIQSAPLHVAPNPATDQIQVEIPKGIHMGMLRITDIHGHPMVNQQVESPYGSSLSFSLQTFPAGIYVVALFGGDQIIYTTRFIK